MLTISKFGEGKCGWCMSHGEGVQAKFQDGLAGFFCKRHFWEALKARGEQPAKAPKEGGEKVAENGQGDRRLVGSPPQQSVRVGEE